VTSHQRLANVHTWDDVMDLVPQVSRWTARSVAPAVSQLREAGWSPLAAVGLLVFVSQTTDEALEEQVALERGLRARLAGAVQQLVAETAEAEAEEWRKETEAALRRRAAARSAARRRKRSDRARRPKGDQR
jgi:hypothetical protein